MRSTPIAIAAGLLQAASASPVELAQRQVTNTPCHDVHFIVARGSYEGYDVGSNRQDNLLVPGVCNGRASCGYEDVVYPAITGDAYCAGSENVGVAAALSQLNDYVGRCPDSKVILTGYSQGAQVVGDMLGGGGGSSCATPNGPMDPNSSPGNKIAAAILFADTRRSPDQAYDYGDAGSGAVGKFPRTTESLDAIRAFGGKVASYCGANDAWCTQGSDGNVHATSVETYHGDAAEFVNGKL